MHYTKFGLVTFITFIIGVAVASYLHFRRVELLTGASSNYPVLMVAVPKKHPSNPNLTCVIPNPFTMIVSVDEKQRIKLNHFEMGALKDTNRLKLFIAEQFQQRIKFRAYKPEVENRTDIAVEECIEKTVTINAAHALKYGDVIELIEEIKSTGANPIELNVDHLSP